MRRIGIAAGRTTGRNMNYFAAVEAAGAQAVAMAGPEDLSRLSSLDGLILPGGGDVNPALYHEENIASIFINDARDSWEKKFFSEAYAMELPVLGICRGIQIINVCLGGSLIQDVPHGEIHRSTEEGDRVHETTVEEDSFLYEVYGRRQMWVNSAHHQAVKMLGRGLRIVQRSKTDGIIEGLCHNNQPVWAVQWHPERMCLQHARTDTEDGLKLFKWFVRQ